MKKIGFRDPVALAFYKTALHRISKNESQIIREQADLLRFSSEIKERLTSAAYYAALGENLIDKKEYEESALLLHFSGQSFRSIGMSSKAGLVYQSSFESGSIAVEHLLKDGRHGQASSLEIFNLRSIGRAINCFNDAGVFDKAVKARRLFHNARLIQLKSENSPLSYLASLTWKYLLDYSLSWGHSALFLLASWALLFTFPSIFTQILAFTSGLAIVAVCIRRFI